MTRSKYIVLVNPRHIVKYFGFAYDRLGQMPLPVDDTLHTELLKRRWRASCINQVVDLTEYDDLFRTILTAVTLLPILSSVELLKVPWQISRGRW